MERKTRSGKTPAVPVAAPTAKRRGRKKKSETEEPEQPASSVPARRSTRGRNADQSVNESLITDPNDESNLSAVTTDTSTFIDETPNESFASINQDEVLEMSVAQPESQESVVVVDTKEPEEPAEEEIVVPEPSQPDVVPEIVENVIDVVKSNNEEAEPVLCALEQQLSDISLGKQSVEPEVEPEEMLLIKPEVQDVEMEETPEPVHEHEEKVAPVEEMVSEVQEPSAPANLEELSVKEEEAHLDTDYMDIDAPFVRRSRRLQSIYVEPAAVPEPVPPPFAVKCEEDPKPAIVESKTLMEDQELISEVKPEPETKPETVVKPPEVYKTVEHTDERLKRYETIRDNIYMKKSDKKVCKVNKTMKCDCTITEEEVKSGEMGCMYNCINRILYIECGAKCRCGEYCDNQQFQRYNYASCSVFDTIVKGFGIRANQDIPAETFVIEYVGEVLDNKQFEKRAKKYSENKNIHYYFMALKSNAIIDATKKGNISRFINHSCDPNAETQKWTVNGELRVGFFSRKDIKEGDEITFDYQYQRYGKEAQKCYCGATSCRGWIGENPLDDEDDDVIENQELDDSKVKKVKPKKGRKPKASLDKSEVEIIDSESEEESEVKTPLKKRDPLKKLDLKKRQFEDMEIEGEIKDLTASGLKNRNQTIRLARLIVRAKNIEARSRIMKILINGDLPCVRLFLDYNGLKLLHNWMCDVNIKSSIPDLELCIEMLKVLEILPITNKTVLRTSKVLDRVEKWKNLDLEKKKMSKEERKQAKAEKKKNKEADNKKADAMSDDQMKTENEAFDAADQMKENLDTSQPPEENILENELLKKKMEIKEAASDLLVKWEGLQEDFKIPKKQKQEIMIEHEREADDWEDDPMVPLSNDRYKNRFGDDSAQSGANRTFTAPYKKQFDPMVTKQQRRQMFEMKVAQIDTEKRMMIAHENNCAIFGLNPAVTNPLDVPVRVNRVTGEYNTIDGRIIAPPPNHYQFKYEPMTLSTNPDDYQLPPIDLPEHWRHAIDGYGRIYYYHEKIRQSQWEAPIKILPLKVDVESGMETPDSDESTTETEDSEEEELHEYLEMLKRKKYLPAVQTSSTNPLVLSGDEDDLEKKIMSNMMKNPVDQPIKLSQAPYRRSSKKKKHGLTSTQFIRPRTEADKIQGRAESKRYKEVKEQLRQRKRRILKGEAQPNDGSSEDEDDEIEDLKIDARRFVDELDILEHSELDRNKAKKEVEKKLKKPKPVVLDPVDVKRQFRDDIKREIAKFLQPYREDSCYNGKITNDVDFHSLISKLTFSVLTKESKHCQSTNSILKATESVKLKTKEYIKKYMGKFEGHYHRKEDEQDYACILNKI